MMPKYLSVAPLLALCVAACADLTAPTSSRNDTTESPASATQKTDRKVQQARAENAPDPSPSPEPSQAAQKKKARDVVGAAHILIAYKGAHRAKPSITRTKKEARQHAEKLIARLENGADFAELAKKESDGPSGSRGGKLGTFPRNRMVKPFADAAFALEPGEISDVVETRFGFHVIKRTE